MAAKTSRSVFRGCEQRRGVPAGCQLVKQNVELPASAGGGRGHIYHDAANGYWYTVGATRAAGVYKVCTFVGGTCPCALS